MVQHDAVQHRARRRVQAKRYIAHSEGGEHARQLLLDQADAFERLDRRVGKLRVTRCQGKGQRIVDQRIRAQAFFIHCHLVKTLRHFELVRRVLCHAFLIDGQHQYRRIVLFGQLKHTRRLGRPALQVGGIDHTATRRGFQCRFHHLWLGGIDHQRHFYPRRQLFDHFAHQLGFIGALCNRHRNIQGVRTALHLLAPQFQDRIIILVQ